MEMEAYVFSYIYVAGLQCCVCVCVCACAHMNACVSLCFPVCLLFCFLILFTLHSLSSDCFVFFVDRSPWIKCQSGIFISHGSQMLSPPEH